MCIVVFYKNGEVILDVSSCVICKRYVLCFVFEVVRLSPSGGLLRAGATSEEFFLFSPRAYGNDATGKQRSYYGERLAGSYILFPPSSHFCFIETSRFMLLGTLSVDRIAASRAVDAR